ncbi:MAG TPA: Nif3-like dinuclear metal center hexameric protein [Armatimonadota bacterium]|nr:Nif3-like dinuclear metal center hexameric protein [Armatimonadota bacterium]
MPETAARDDVLAYLHDYLNVAGYRDYGPQGLQVEGRAVVRKVVSGVSGGVALFQRAAAAGADMVIAHHGIFWDRESRVVKGGLKHRLELLLQHRMTLAAYHLCLDAHPEVGNNVLGARGLGLQNIRPWGEHNGKPIGFRGEWEGEPVPHAVSRVNALYDSSALAFLHGPDLVRSVGIISGGAQAQVRDAIELGLDMFITGEASEFVMSTAREGNIHFLAAGHHNTERLGIRAVGDHLAEKFGIEHEFIDIPNPV